MVNILILYYSAPSKRQHVRDMAHHIAAGVTQAGGEACIRRPRPIDTQPHESNTEGTPWVELSDLENCHALALGSPSHFGNMAAPLKHFLDQTTGLWVNGTLINKPAGVFCSSASLHGGQETTLLSMMIPLLHHGAMIVGLPYSEPELSHTQSGGTPYGPSHWAGPHSDQPLSSEEIRLCQAFGKRLTNIATQYEKTL